MEISNIEKMNEIILLAKQFTSAIYKALADEQFNWEYEPFHFDRMKQFPYGCCDDACDLFWYYLFITCGTDAKQISSEYIEENTRHNWLETEDGIIIDLTSGQFKNRPIIFVGFDDGFYGQMEDKKEYKAYDISKDKRLKRDYDIILRYMNPNQNV